MMQILLDFLPVLADCGGMSSPADQLLNAVDWQPNGNHQPDWKEGDIPYATHEGVFRLGDLSIRCVQLNTGERLLVAEDVEKLFGSFGS